MTKHLRRAIVLIGLLAVLALQIFLYSYQDSHFRSLSSFHSTVIDAEQPESVSSIPIRRKPRLELFHIPKTGGTMLEELAGKHNVTWGACHFYNKVLHSKNTQWKQMSPWPSCPAATLHVPPDKNATFPINSPNYWHLPLYLLPDWLDYDPYDLGVVDSALVNRPKQFFTVVRNPYERIISLYYYVNFKTNESTVHNANRLHDFVLGRIQEACAQVRRCRNWKSHCSAMFWCGTQYDFVYNKDKQQMIPYILKYESLAKDFNALSAKYELNFTIAADETPPKRHRLLTPMNLSDEALVFINRVFRNDFDFGYEMIQPKATTSLPSSWLLSHDKRFNDTRTH